MTSVSVPVYLIQHWKQRYRTYPSLLQAVTNQDLTGRLLVLLRQRLECRVVGLLVADQGAVGLDNNVVGLTELDSHALLVPGVQLECFVSDARTDAMVKNQRTSIWLTCGG
jgi:hypothetical protein